MSEQSRIGEHRSSSSRAHAGECSGGGGIVGFSIKAVPFQNAVLNVKELGGADHIRKYWSRYYQGSQGVIFVLDSASSEGDLETARSELHSALQHPQLCTLPFLILASHQDKPALLLRAPTVAFPQLPFRYLPLLGPGRAGVHGAISEARMPFKARQAPAQRPERVC
ncbi:PREDICTED: ADP-ribosylation factor-like protein 15 [Myotis brandtii]|uniref:ADP-ribosylation factor-like protein 15 n=1 Tax=Myotis brandtii TaxID=109478 RepID=UPI000703EFDB|nr:PREDICTED: ADP-ribosylation factor-like protein 15 [Myotis brandtii]